MLYCSLGVRRMKLEDRKQKKHAKMRRRLFFRIAVLAVLIGSVVFVLVANAKKDKYIYRAGDDAPDFKLSQINDEIDMDSIQLSKLEGKGVMINFWATYCKPCEEEMPYMQGLYDIYQDQGFEIIAVNVDSTEFVATQFVKKFELNFPVVRDSEKLVRELYSIKPLPSSIFISPEGKIVRKVDGKLELEQLEGFIKEILPNNS